MEFNGTWRIGCSGGSSSAEYDLKDGDVIMISGAGATRTVRALPERKWGLQTATLRGTDLRGELDNRNPFTITRESSTTIRCSINGGMECFGGPGDSDPADPCQSGSWTADDDPC